MQAATHLGLGLVTALCLGSVIDPQEEHADREPDQVAVSVAGRSVGLQRAGAEFIGGGQGYKIRFRTGAVELTPAFGRAAPRNFPLTFALDSIRLGEHVFLRADGSAEPHATGPRRVTYDHGLGIVERYDVRADGVEQSFVFDSLPDTTGELVVRGLLSTELKARALDWNPDSGLRLERAGVGSVDYGGVTGVDAAGRQCAGRLRTDGAWLELVLPADFVATAELPLVLDPLIGGTVSIATSTNDEGSPDVAYDAGNDVYLVVFERHFSDLDGDIRAQRVDSAGNLVGNTSFIESNAFTVATRPSVASSTQTDEFFIAWQEGPTFFGPWDVRGRALLASGGLPSAVVSIAAGVDNELDPDVGGEASTADNDVLVVWTQEGTGLRGRQVSLNGGSPSLLASFTISNDPGDSRPAISKSGGASGTFAIVWQRFFDSPAPGDHDILARIFSRNGVAITSEMLLGGSIGPDEEDPDVDGDGVEFHVVWEREASIDSGDNDVWCRKLRLSGSTLVLDGPEVLIKGEGNDDEIDPAVAHVGSKVLVSWSDQFFFLDYDLMLRELDSKNCGPCGFEDSAALGPRFYGRPAIASTRSGDPTAAPAALLVWESADLVPPFAGDVHAKRIAGFGPGGAIANLGGGCGGAGAIGTQGPFAVGNSDFQVTLSGADPAATSAILAFNPTESLLSCNPCEWLIWHSAGLLFMSGLSGGGASVNVPVPCSLTGAVGLPLHCQWTVIDTSATACVLVENVGLSDRLRLVIGI